MNKITVLLLTLLLGSMAAQAQFFIGLRGSNYGGIHRKALTRPKLMQEENFQAMFMHERVNSRDKRADC